MKFFLLILVVALSTADAFLLATRAVKSPGFSLNSLKQKKDLPKPKAQLAKKATKKIVAKKMAVKKIAAKAVPKKVAAKKKPAAKTVTAVTDVKEWRLFGRDRDSKSPPLFLKLYDGSNKLGKYPDLSGVEKSADGVKRNPYKNNAPL